MGVFSLYSVHCVDKEMLHVYDILEVDSISSFIWKERRVPTLWDPLGKEASYCH
jgi:hypothetical protein